MAYDKASKAKADAARYQRRREFLLAQKKARRLANKPLVREGTPSKEELRQCIEQGYCWWCQRGGWRRLAQHTAMSHRIYADDVRRIAIMLKRKPTCVKEESEVMSDNRRRAMALGHAKAPDWRLAQGIKHEYSEAGLAHQRELARHMRDFITPEVRERCSEAITRALSKPHPCPVCGTIIPHSKPICCSEECRKQRAQIGLSIGHRLWYQGNPIAQGALQKGRKLWQVSEYREKMLAMLNEVRQPPKSHRCPTCGGVVPKSRPLYCSTECSNQALRLPWDKIIAKYLNAQSQSLTTLSREYGVDWRTIRSRLKERGIAIRHGNSKN